MDLSWVYNIGFLDMDASSLAHKFKTWVKVANSFLVHMLTTQRHTYQEKSFKVLGTCVNVSKCFSSLIQWTNKLERLSLESLYGLDGKSLFLD